MPWVAGGMVLATGKNRAKAAAQRVGVGYEALECVGKDTGMGVGEIERVATDTPIKKGSALAPSVAHRLVSHQLPTVKHHRQAKVLHRRVATAQGRVR